MAATISDICRRSGLSSATVSRVINNSPLVSQQTRDRVRRVMDEMDYRPSYAARTLVRRRTDTLGVVFPQIAGGFYTDLLRGIDSVAAEENQHLLTAFAHGVHDETALIDRMLMEGRVDAAILLNLDLPDSFLRDLGRHRLPVVLVDRPTRDGGQVAISIDNRNGAASALSHLVSHGHRDIVLLTGPATTYDSLERLAGCRTAAAGLQVELPDDHVHTGDFTIEGGQRFMREWLATHAKPPPALFAFNDAMALGAFSVARERGFQTPRDMALVGFDDCEAAQFVGLTTVHVPLENMGRVAGRAALALSRGETTAHAHIMPTHLVVRDSCGGHHG